LSFLAFRLVDCKI